MPPPRRKRTRAKHVQGATRRTRRDGPKSADWLSHDVLHKPEHAHRSPQAHLPYLGTCDRMPWTCCRTPWTCDRMPLTCFRTPWTCRRTPWTPWTCRRTPWTCCPGLVTVRPGLVNVTYLLFFQVSCPHPALILRSWRMTVCFVCVLVPHTSLSH